MKTTYTLNKNHKPSKEQINRINKASEMPIQYDEDSPMLTEDQINTMRQIAIEQRASRVKEVVAIRLDKESIAIAKQLAPTYTGFLGRILYKALRDPEYIKDCL